ncbi:MAG: hypothetical protein ABIP17_09475 [Ilumatobacteraceae bacterium]
MAVSKKQSTAKKAPVKKAPVKKAPAKQAATKAAKKAPAKKVPTKQTPAKRAPVKKAAGKQVAGKQVAGTKVAGKRAPAKQAAATKVPAKKAPAKTAPAKKAPATNAPGQAAPAKQASAKPTPSSSRSIAKRATPTNRSSARKAQADTDMARSSNHASVPDELPKPRFNKDGFGYTKDFDLSFVKDMHDALQEERIRLTGQAKRLEDEATQLVEEAEMGDVQFDDEGGEGDTMVVERERDLALSAQAREAIAEIDAAIERIKIGTYGYSVVSGSPIPRERLEAIPWSTELVAEKVGGIGR